MVSWRLLCLVSAGALSFVVFGVLWLLDPGDRLATYGIVLSGAALWGGFMGYLVTTLWSAWGSGYRPWRRP